MEKGGLFNRKMASRYLRSKRAISDQGVPIYESVLSPENLDSCLAGHTADFESILLFFGRYPEMNKFRVCLGRLGPKYFCGTKKKALEIRIL